MFAMSAYRLGHATNNISTGLHFYSYACSGETTLVFSVTGVFTAEHYQQSYTDPISQLTPSGHEWRPREEFHEEHVIGSNKSKFITSDREDPSAVSAIKTGPKSKADEQGDADQDAVIPALRDSQ
jgi:hypothetical protein